jgi:hypothetical protein
MFDWKDKQYCSECIQARGKCKYCYEKKFGGVPLIWHDTFSIGSVHTILDVSFMNMKFHRLEKMNDDHESVFICLTCVSVSETQVQFTGVYTTVFNDEIQTEEFQFTYTPEKKHAQCSSSNIPDLINPLNSREIIRSMIHTIPDHLS